MKKEIGKFIKQRYEAVISELLINDKKFRSVIFAGLNVLLALVSFGMTIVNIFTKEYVLMWSTLVFAVLCFANVFIERTKFPKLLLNLIFGAEVLALFSFFIVTGNPDGFSVLWIALVPCFALFIYGNKTGSIFCGIVFILLIAFFWLPGKQLLLYEYNPTFMLRFPLFYIAIYVISLFIELFRAETKRRMIESENRYKHLCRHDVLTMLYNRLGFFEAIDNIIIDEKDRNYAAMMIDIDDFKKINDNYGHSFGDQVLKDVADILRSHVCENTRFCRWGGEEFLVVTNCNHCPEEKAEAIRKAVEEAVYELDGKAAKLTVSIGVCVSETKNKDVLNDMIKEADRLLYVAKSQGKNLVISGKLN